MSEFNKALHEHQATFARVSAFEPASQQAAAICNVSSAAAGKSCSAAGAQHLEADLVGRLVDDRPALAGLALTTDSSALTPNANDYSFDDVLVRQVVGLGRPGDVMIGIPASENSENVRKEVIAAGRIGIRTIGFLGRDGGKTVCDVEISIVFPCASMARIQEIHLILKHVVCAKVERNLLINSQEV